MLWSILGWPLRSFFFQICDNYFLRSTGFYLICAVYGNVGRTDLDNRRIEHLWWRKKISFVSPPHGSCIFLWKHLFTIHTEQIMEKRDDVTDLISENATTDLEPDLKTSVRPQRLLLIELQHIVLPFTEHSPVVLKPELECLWHTLL